ncbi:TIGR03936 family radical SAM-associated protein [Clostridium amazonitimonense]|uniref:TIGR03936 family radical SAM-associated protein n=1 Tax=Clostridium amazonitimonense TaxID=1499689 RepID=UPI000509B62E|nr:TIGR03936 family radical SAM-associated protein [Clostridium amazonitimonense]
MRYLIKFTKESDIKFISHLDLMRTIQKVIRRSNLPIEYSKGFNPHQELSIAQPLSVGVYSSGEYMDIVLREELNEEEIKHRLNANCPRGISILEVVKVPEPKTENTKKTPQGMALIDLADYTIKIKFKEINKVEEQLQSLLSLPEWNTMKKSKRGEREVDIKSMIKEFKFWTLDKQLIIKTRISSGSREHLSPELLANYIKENIANADLESFVDIKREEMLAYKGNKVTPLYKYMD